MPANVLLSVHGTVGGNIQPFLSIGARLRVRGHQVTLISHSVMAQTAQAAGLDFAPLDTPEEYARFQAAARRLLDKQDVTASDRVTLYRENLLPTVPAEFRAIRERVRAGETILIARFSMLGAAMAAERLGVPRVRVFDGPRQGETMWFYEHFCKTQIGADIKEIRRQLELPPIPSWNRWLNSAHTIGLWAETFAPPTREWPAGVVPVGFLWHDPHPGELPADVLGFLDEGPPPVVITIGTGSAGGAARIAASVEACRLLGRRALVVCRHESDVPRPLPDGVRWFSWVPSMSALVSRASAVIHHGGMGTTGLVSHAGLPQLALPNDPDTGFVAGRIEQLELGAQLGGPNWDPRDLARCLEQIHAPRVVERSRTFAQQLRGQDGAQRACEMIEGLLDQPDFMAATRAVS